VIHPRSPKKAEATSVPELSDMSSVVPGAEGHSEVTVAPAHAKVDRHHADMRPAQTLNDVYLSSNLADGTQAVVATGSKYL
jgi:hypothetical protein